MDNQYSNIIKKKQKLFIAIDVLTVLNTVSQFDFEFSLKEKPSKTNGVFLAIKLK